MIDELALWEQIAFVASLTIISLSLLWTLWLFRLARRDVPVPPEASTDDFTWVFLVPALNEEVTIADSVERLSLVRCARRHIVVIDDASTDRTPEVLRGITHSDLRVLRRELPDAQRGKAAALNDAWRRLPELVGDLDRSRTVVCIVDADGRLDPDAPESVAAFFADDEVGGVQVRVRIYNRYTLLTRAQDIEFGVYGGLYQAARSYLGTAGMGGNGQFNRLTALDSVAEDADGPWRDTLTEDQDVGLRLLAAGWRCRHDNAVSVHQQGLNNLRRLLRQRTRWAQGNLQAMTHLGEIHRFPITHRARLDLTWSLLQPVVGAVVGFGFAAALWAFFTRGVAFIPTSLLLVALFFTLGFGGVVMGVVARTGRGLRAWVSGVLVGIAYAAYAWLLWPALSRATWRQLRAKGTWAKTEREAIEPLAEAA